MPSSTDLSAAELALVTDQKPMLIASNVLDDAAVRWNDAGTSSDGALDHASYPATYAHDQFHHLYTTTSSAKTTWYYVVNMNTAQDFDAVAILGHNFGTIGGLTVTLELDDNNNGSYSSTTTLSTWSPGSSNDRLSSIVLAGAGVAERHSGHSHVRLKLTKGSTFTPQIGELWIGRRRHLPYQFDGPLGDQHHRADFIDFASRSGVRTRHQMSKGQRVFSGSMLIDQSADITSINTFWSEADYGNRPFLWIPDPGTPANVYVMHHSTGELDFGLELPAARRFNLDMIEQAPFKDTE